MCILLYDMIYIYIYTIKITRVGHKGPGGQQWPAGGRRCSASRRLGPSARTHARGGAQAEATTDATGALRPGRVGTIPRARVIACRFSSFRARGAEDHLPSGAGFPRALRTLIGEAGQREGGTP
jgi:hypothetical protein